MPGFASASIAAFRLFVNPFTKKQHFHLKPNLLIS
ncbi:hypothetical protein EM595_0756 [Duffyella gerundensis]|uniref:Uncharacterized protein n=1 Tax=Duffyella gerundensis TaxID=1619313 RepID=A0A0U5L1B9_9GAMM|nr:hypothetical protein EM595_0756 [Duffyella gerundensis]